METCCTMFQNLFKFQWCSCWSHFGSCAQCLARGSYWVSHMLFFQTPLLTIWHIWLLLERADTISLKLFPIPLSLLRSLPAIWPNSMIFTICICVTNKLQFRSPIDIFEHWPKSVPISWIGTCWANSTSKTHKGPKKILQTRMEMQRLRRRMLSLAPEYGTVQMRWKMECHHEYTRVLPSRTCTHTDCFFEKCLVYVCGFTRPACFVRKVCNCGFLGFIASLPPWPPWLLSWPLAVLASFDCTRKS